MEAARSILIPDGEDELALRVLRCLAEVPSLKVASLSRDGRAPIRFSRHLSRFLTHSVDGLNRERIEVIKEAAQAVDADIIFPTGLLGIRLVAAYREQLATIAHLPPLASTEMLDLYAKPELALKGLVGRWSGKRAEVPGLSESGAYYMLKDPVPDLAIQLSRVSRRLFG